MSRRETIELNSSPLNEDGAQIGEPDYGVQGRAECVAYRRQLVRHAARKGVLVLATDLRLFVKANAHDFGTYYEVAASFAEDDERAAKVAYWLEENQPETWDEEALLELGREPKVEVL